MAAKIKERYHIQVKTSLSGDSDGSILFYDDLSTAEDAFYKTLCFLGELGVDGYLDLVEYDGTTYSVLRHCYLNCFRR